MNWEEGNLEEYFRPYRENIVGIDASFESPYGRQKVVYADWTASGRLYHPIERKLLEEFGPFVGNTHSETTETGTRMTLAYHEAHRIIKEHVHAGTNDIIITAGSGMTTVVNKLQRILSLKGCSRVHIKECTKLPDRPVVFITHMEHHSNHTSWYETMADVVILPPTPDLLVNPDILREEIKKYKDRPFKIGAFTACSNVTGIRPPYRELARIMHKNGGIVFIDFAASAPYDVIDMHPPDPMEKLDAIYFSPHKFLGGPGSSGVLIFDRSLYHSEVPDQPGGGTVDWTNPWGSYKYVDDIEAREDGGTPGFLQAIRAALAIRLKEQMNPEIMAKREKEITRLALNNLRKVHGIKILADKVEERLPIFSFYHPEIHFNLIVRILNDRFGIQVRGGCACAGTYGHYLLEVSYEKSREITQLINSGDLSKKPGWVRWSLHPTTTNEEIVYFIDSLRAVIQNIDNWKKDYIYNPKKNEFYHVKHAEAQADYVNKWFTL